MSIKIDIDVCRICCKSAASHSIYQYAKKFHYCTSIEIAEKDGLPGKICDTCLERMKIAVEFKKKSESSDKLLKGFIASVNNQFSLTLVGSEDNDEDEADERQERMVLPNAVDSVQEADPKQGEIEMTVLAAADEEGHNVEQEDEPENEPEDEPGNEPEQEHEQEKFRAVAVIQEKPAVKSEKDIFEVVEVEYDDNILQQDDLSIEDPEQHDDPCEEPIEAEESGQVFYISLPNYEEIQEPVQHIDESSSDQKEETEKSSSPSSNDRSTQQYKFASLIEERKLSVSTSKESNVSTSGKFLCVKCNKSFSTKTNLNRHLQSHDGKKPFVCPLCEKGFTQNGSLKQHLLIHQNLRPYVCMVCDQGFTQQKSLTFHMRRHTNEKPFVCPCCNYAFRQKDGLKRHMLVRHSEKGAKTFTCDECGKAYQTKYALGMHQKRHESSAKLPLN